MGLGSFSYIERDYQDILSTVIEKIPQITPEWTDWNQSDIGIAILQLFTGMAEMLAYTEDQHANQLTIPTCTQRESMINLTASLAYSMANVTASSVDLLLSRTAYTTTVATTTLNAPVPSNTRTIKIPSAAYPYATNDVLHLDNGVNSEYVIIDYVVTSGGESTVTIKGVTLYGYSAGNSVGIIDEQKNVIIADNLRCSTSGANPIYFETYVPESSYTIYAGNQYVDQTTVLSYNTTNNTITVSNAFDFIVNDTLYLKSSLYTNTTTLTISDISSRTLTLSETLPSWIQIGDIISRLVPASQGTTRTETLSASTGLPSQERELTYTPLIDTSVEIEVNEGSAYETWTLVDSFYSSDSNDKNYTLEIQANDKGLITFGDGVNGKVPTLNAEIRASYVQGGGVSGNIGKNSINKVIDSVTDVGGNVVSVTVNNPSSSSGGSDKESLDIARVRAPALYASVYRALSLSDFEALSVGYRDATYGTIANAIAVESGIDNAVSIYVWAADNNGFATTTSSGLKNSLKNYLESRSAAGYLVSVLDGYTTSVNITATIYVQSGYTQSAVRSAVTSTINSLFQVETLSPSEDFHLGNLYEAIENTEGVDRADITLPLRPGVNISTRHIAIRGTILLTMSGGSE